MGYRMPGWYDIAVLDGSEESLREHEDEAGILLSRTYFRELVQKEINAGIPAERIVLGGFSQGGAISAFTGLTSTVKIAGIVALSSYLLLAPKFAEFLPKPEMNKETPMFMAHGDADPVVPHELGRKSYETLKGLGYNVQWKEYPGMAHSACLEELDDVEAFLRKTLPALGSSSDDKSEL